MSIKLKHSGGNSVSLNPPTSAPTASEVAFKLPNADGSSGQYMKTDGSGNLAFATVATPSVPDARLTVWDTWILTSNISNYEGVITSNLARPSAMGGISWGTIGTGMTESSGVFTFPQTGLWEVVADFQFSSGTAQQYSSGEIQVSSDSGSNFSRFSHASNAAPSNGTYSIRCSALMDITNISTTRIRFFVGVTANWTSGHSIDGNSNYAFTKFEFRRVGDT